MCCHAQIQYSVPADAPESVEIICTWSPADGEPWHTAKVIPNISETAVKLLPADEWNTWVRTGRITEHRAAGLERTVIFNPYPEAQKDGKVDLSFRIEVRSVEGALLKTETTPIQCDNSDVVTIEDWSKVTTQDAVSTDEPGEEGDSLEEGKWHWRSGLEAEEGVTFGNALYGKTDPDEPLPPLSYPLSLKGPYAIFVCSAPSAGSVKLRLTGDERSDSLASRKIGEEVLWRWARMDRQHLVLSQPHHYTGSTPGHIDYVKFVPLTDEQVQALEAQFGGEPDKIVAGYFEPYSWAFVSDVRETLQHRAPLTAFAEARVPEVHIQIGRFGMKVVYETRLSDQLLHATIGDPIGAVKRPTTHNVGKMQQYTNTLDAELRYARELGLTAHANFGASNCYPGSPLQGDFSKEHPDWMRGSMLRFEVPEVKEYALSLYREALTIGARGLSLDFCRYPETIDRVETGNAFLRDLRRLADEFSEETGSRIPILVRFPGTGVRRAELFDYRTWAQEGWVDSLAPSNIQGRHQHIDMKPYFEAVRGTDCTLLPCVDALGWALPLPGPFLWRIAQLYEQGAPGIYIYQADARVLGQPEDRRTMRRLASSTAVREWWEDKRVMRPTRSKGIYITSPHQIEGYNKWERLRIWTEGVPLGELEIYLDDQRVSHYDSPPYLVGTEENASDAVIPPGEHTLRIRARDGDGWLEKTFAITGG